MRNILELINKSSTHTVKDFGFGMFTVQSGESGKIYLVDVKDNSATCTCPWGKYRPQVDGRTICSHTLAVFAELVPDGYNVTVRNGNADSVKHLKRMTWKVGAAVVITLRK